MVKLFFKKYTNLIVKSLVALLLLWTIYRQVFGRDNIDELWSTFLSHFYFPNLFWLFLIIALVPFNWGFETLKWQQLIKNFSKLSFWQSYKAILAGVTISLFTPNRIGEYGGRILLVEAKNNLKAIVATLVGSMAQLMTILTFGLLGALYFSSHFLEVETYLLQIILFFGFLLIALLLFCFFNIELIIPILKKIPFVERFRKYVEHVKVLKSYSPKLLGRALFYAVLRFFTYSFQYYLILLFFEIEVPLLLGFSGIATVFLLQTSIPLPPILGLLARAGFALEVWGQFGASELDILGASFGLFVINLTIPALLGLVFIVQTNVAESLGMKSNKPDSL